jgi:threonine 3-dehydrogenase
MSFLGPDTKLPMMYMADCIRATNMLLEAPATSFHSSQRVFNVTAFSFTPQELAAAIQQFLPHFTIQYAPDFRQAIADSWPTSIDDSMARTQWQWAPDYTLESMVHDMLVKIEQKLTRFGHVTKTHHFSCSGAMNATENDI